MSSLNRLADLLHEIEHRLAVEGFDVEQASGRYFDIEMWCAIVTASPIPGVTVRMTSRAKMVDHFVSGIIDREKPGCDRLYVGPDKAKWAHRDKWMDRCQGFGADS